MNAKVRFEYEKSANFASTSFSDARAKTADCKLQDVKSA
jgi:hypothetical protein